MSSSFKVLPILIFVSCSLAHAQTDSTSAPRKWGVTLEAGRHVLPFAFNDMFGLARWEQRYTIRVGIGAEINQHFWGDLFFEYRRYKSETKYGELNPWLYMRSYLRTEFAFYASITAFGFLQGGIGAISQSHEEMFYSAIYSSMMLRHPAESHVRFFYITGIKYDIPISGDFYIPIGLYADMFLGEDGIVLPSFKLGLQKRL